MMRAAVLAVLLVSAAVIGLDTPLVMADNHLPEGAFVTTWNVTASSYTISIPVEVHTGGTLTIDWGDGTAAVEVTTNGIHSYTYLASGEYQVSMTGDLSRIILGAPGGTPSKLASIYQWGDIEWSSMKDAFSYTSNMKYNASDVPNLSGVSSMENMFNLASKFDGDLSEWNVSAVTYMRGVFAQTLSFNGDVSTWNVSAVTDMKGMFFSASTFNGDISSWNVSAVTNMNGMFSGASTFNGDISSWNVSAVTDMNRMFSGASDFNGDISNWNVSAVTYMTGMFEGASDFTGDISNWNVSAVTGMNRMFSGASDFNGDISNWNVSAVTDMNNMFASASSFNQPLNDWNVSAVTDMGSMFSDTTAFERNLGKWYVVPADTVYNTSDETSLVITTIAAQNFFLNSNHTPNYGIGTGGNSTLFSMTGSNLVFKATPSAVTYTVNVTASGSNVFENGNNWRTLTVTVTGQDNHLPDITAGGSADVYEGSVGRLTGTASDPDTGDILTYQWTHNGTLSLGITIANNTALSTTFEVAGDVTTDTSVTFTLTVNDGTSLPVTNTVDVTVQDSSGAFIATWKTGAQQKRVTLFVSGTNPVIDWGDGSERTSSTGRVGHIYAKADQYRVIVDGSVSRLEFYGGTPNLLRYVDQWGDIEWSSILNMFRGASNMEYRATDTPDLSRVTTMESMFNQATSFNGDISNWNVSAVTNMRFTFAGASAFNGDISNWNVSAVTDMRYMFDGASMFDGDISNWNVSAVTDMNSMFNVASAFNGDISNWNVSAVTDMNSMFNYASMFDGDISNWNVSAVTDMSSMFNGATSFDQPLDRWNVSAVTDMNYMFNDASLFNQPLNDWDVSAVTDMHYMFNDVSLFNQPLNDWDVSAVTDMHNMFAAASDFGGDISSWNVSAVTDMHNMFLDASLFNQPLNDWNVSAVTDMTAMFQDASKFNQPLNDWNVSAVTGMNFMFFHADDFEQNLGEWYILPAEAAYDITDASLNVTVISAQNFILDGHNPTYGIDPDDGLDSGLFNMTGSTLMFKVTPYVGTYTVNVTASGSSVFERGNNWRTLTVTVTGQEDRPLLVDAGPDQRVLDESAVTLSGTVSDSDSTDLTYLWTQNSGSPAVALTGSDTPTPTFTAPDVSSDVDLIFTLRVSDGTDTDTDTVTVTVHDAEADFVTTWSDITAGTNFPIRNSTGSFTVDWGDGKISEYAARATDGSLVHLYDIPGTYTIRISGNFSGIYLQDNIATAGKLQSIDQWGDIKWTTMAGAFYFAINMIYNATDVPDLSSVTDMSNMFTNTGFSSDDLSGWDVSGVTDMRSMFLSSGYTGDLSDWDVSSVTDMQNMFSRTSSFDSDLSGWNVSAVTDMSGMFSRASSFDSDLSGWNVSSVTSTQNMFLDAAFFDSDLSDWNVSSVTDMRTMFTGATSFNSDLSGWNVSAVNNMDDMFSGATSFEQNLGKWYVVPADTDYDAANETTLVVTAIAAQNSFLNGHTHNYAIGTGGNSELFSMTGSNLVFKDTTPSAQVYKVNVTAPGGDFGTNNHHVFDITVTGEDNHQPDVTAGGSADVYEGSVGRLTGTASDPDTGDILTYQWTHNGTPSLGITIANNTALSTTFEVAGDVTTDTSVTFTLTVNDGTSLSVTKTVGVNIQDSSGAFIATWGTTSPQTNVRFFIGGTNPVIDWGDGSERTSPTVRAQHTYAEAGQYRVIVNGSVDRLYHLDGTGTPEMLRYVDQWGDIEWSSMRDMFHGASNMEYRATYTPDLSRVTTMESMFNQATSFNGDISNWNVSTVTNMRFTFADAFAFNGDISNWNVSKVTNMNSMFFTASVFNGDISNWNVSKVTDMANMFLRAFAFNGDISNWNVSAVTNMRFTFAAASDFNGDISNWNVSKVTDTSSMFDGASMFNGDVSNWNVSKVTDMNYMFDGATSFDQPLDRWNVSAVTDMRNMFNDASLFNQPLNDWDVSAVTDMNSMFSAASDFNGDISNWNVSAVTDMTRMFLDASEFNQPLNDWDVSAVTDMIAMFQDASKFNQPLNDWNVSAVTDMNFMFLNADDFEQNLGKWYVVPADTVYNTSDETSLAITTIAAQNFFLNSNHTPNYGIGTGGNSTLFSMTGSNLVFKATPSAGTYTVNVTAPGGDFGTNNHRVLDITVEGQDDSTVSAGAFLTTWNVAASQYTISIPVEVHTDGTLTIDWGDNAITPVATNGTQSHTYSASDEYQVSMTGDLSRIILGNTGSTASKLVSIDQWGDIEWSSMEGAFRGASNMEYKAADAPDLSHVISMQNMFRDASSFNGNLSDWNVSTVTNMDGTFRGASDFNGDVSSWDTSSATDMRNMFQDADNFDGDISGWDVSKVTDTSSMFYEASDFNQPLNGWDVSKVTDMSFMFDDADSFNQPLNGWDVSKVTDMSFMFFGTAFFDGDLTGWDVSKVTDMSSMFDSASYFDRPLDSWDVSSVTEMNSMFASADSFNRPLNSWNVSAVTDMFAMFRNTDSFNGDISGWDVSKVTDMSLMFSGASFNGDISGWDVSKVTDMSLMFSGVFFEQNLGKWYVVPVDTVYDAATEITRVVTAIAAQNSFLDEHFPNYGIGTGGDFALFSMTGSNLVFKSTPPSAGTYTVNVTASGSSVFENGNNWRTLTVTVTGQEDRPLLVDAGPDQRVLDESEVTLLGTVSDSDSTNLTYLWTQNPGSPAVTLAGSDTLMPTFTAPDVSSDVDLIFTLRVDDGPDTVTDTVTVTVHNAEADFVTTWSDIHVGINIPIRSSAGSFTVDWGDGKITEYAAIATDRSLAHLYDIPGTYAIRISGNFSGIYLQDIPGVAGRMQSIDQWGDIKWTTMAGAFSYAGNMLYNATDVPDLSSVTDTSSMFLDTTDFSSGDLSGWDVSGVTDMRTMFASSGYTGDLSSWNVSSVTDMQSMFSRASSFDSDLSGWDVSAVTNMNSMFFDASLFDSDLSDWDVSSVATMQSMFIYASSFNSDLSGWDVSAVTNMNSMFDGATSFEQNLGPWYIVLDSDTIFYPTQTLGITAQNSFLDRQNPVYDLGVGGDSYLFVVDAAAGTLGLDPNSDPSPPPNGIYQVSVTSTGSFGTANHHTVSVTVDNADPAVMPPTFYSSVFNNVTGVLTIVFSETIDAANVVPAKIHIRESGNYTDGITLSAGEFVTVANDTAISFILIASHLTTVTGLTTPELTIEPGAVQDMFGNLIDGTFDVSTAVFVNATSVSSQDTKPYGIAFSNNGTKMFVVGDYHNNINQYTLSIPFDISNATYDGNDERFSALQDTSPRGMTFSNNGTKMFVVGYTNKNITQYALSSPFDVSTASFTTATSVLSQDRFPRGMAFSNDGLKMFVVGSDEDAINQYTLSAAFDLSIVIPVTPPFYVPQDNFPKDMAFSNDGTKMFVIGSSKGAINQYTLSTPFNLVNAIYDGDDERFSVSLQDGDPAGMTFSNDGAKMFVVGDHENDVNEYALSSVYPITVTNEAAIDTTAPVIELDGPATITITVGGTYNEQGAVCDDDVDLDKPATVGGQTVDVDAVGTYIITYDCTDTSNNAATQVTRTVTVEAAIDTTAPVIELDGPATITITVGGTYNEQGAVCDDDVDLDKPATVGGQTVDVDAVGTYIITYDCTDTSNNAATQVTRTVTVTTAADNTSPVIELDGPATITITVGGTYNEQGAVCDDDVDLDKPATVGGQTVDVDAVGTYIITYDCTDTSNNAATQVTRTVTVEAAIDTTAPVIELDGPATITITVGGTYNEQGAVCDDDVDLDKPATVGGQTVDVDAVGTYIITYDCTDTSNNAATQVTRTVTVTTAADNTSPVIELDGPATITITVGGTYNEQGAVCDDDVDLDKPATVGGQTVDVDAVGTYIITYDCTDTSNNAATQVTRTVTVEAAIDTTAPVIELDGPATITITVGGTYNEQGAVCDDDVDLDKPATVGGQTVDVDAVGTYIITYDCTDTSNNAATQVTRTVTVTTAADNTSPVIELDGPATITITVGGTYNEQGAVCDDDVDLDKPATVGGQTVDVDAVGTYIITYDCTDTSNNAATQVTRTVTVEAAIDTTAPVIELDGPATITITVGGTYNEQGAVCDDDVDLDKPATVGGQTVDVDAVGTYIITYDCTDTSNNAATQVTRTVTVEAAIDTTATCHRT